MPRRKDEPGFSRRSFLKTVGAGGVAAGTVLTNAPVTAQGGVNAVGPGAVPITLNVNGKAVQLQIEPRVTLLDALRMRADMTGSKRGCDRGACGACTMIVEGKRIRTVDGLASASGQLHPVQQAFCDKDALMCGFCTPGFIMASVGLLEKHPNATPEQIKKGLDGNICRCGTFNRIFEAVSSVKGVRRG
jgi:xanthine dehydrogenase YagT iron-sulfur-binding subunit